MKKFLQGFGIIWTSTCILVLFGALFGLFGISSFVRIFDLALTFTIVAVIAFYAISAAIWLPLKAKNPGRAIPTLIGVLSGTIAIWLVGQVVPGTVLFSGFWAALPLSALNTVMIWGITLAIVKNRVPRPFWPEFK